MRVSTLLAALFVVLIGGPASAQRAQDYFGLCSEPDCKTDQKEFSKWFPKAMRGDYQGQRNIAFYLSGNSVTGTHGAIIANKITACAWRMVIIGSGSPHVDSSDTANVKRDCGKLDDVERIAAQAQATALITKIKR